MSACDDLRPIETRMMAKNGDGHFYGEMRKRISFLFLFAEGG